jgi:hypothetical protein
MAAVRPRTPLLYGTLIFTVGNSVSFLSGGQPRARAYHRESAIGREVILRGVQINFLLSLLADPAGARSFRVGNDIHRSFTRFADSRALSGRCFYRWSE